MDESKAPAGPAVAAEQPKKKPRFFYGWDIVAATFFTHWLGAGVGVPNFGQFFKPMSEELGWSRTQTTWPLAIRNVIAQLTGPIVGPLMDKYGPRYLMTVGAIIVGIGTMLMSQVHSMWQFILYFSVIGAIGNAGLSGIVTNTALAQWFVRMRGRATGISATGINFGEVVMTPLAFFLIESMGWRSAWIVLGLLPWIVVVPTAWIWMRRAPEDMGLRPDGDPPPQDGVARESARPGRGHIATEEHSWTPKAAFKSPALWLIMVSTTLASISVSGVVTHQIPYMTDKGFSPGIAAFVLSTYAACAIPSKLVWGFLSERVHIRYLTAASLLGSAVGLLILINADSVWKVFLFGVVYGSTRGAWSVVTSLVWANYFGRHFLGTIRGLSQPFNVLSSVGGPIFAAMVYDETGSYIFAFSIFVGTYVMGATLILLAKPGKPPEAEAQHTPQPAPASAGH